MSCCAAWLATLGLDDSVVTADVAFMPQPTAPHELVLCPAAFDYPASTDSERRSYVESMDVRREEAEFDWSDVPSDKVLIYCSLGSQHYRPGVASGFLHRLIQAVTERDDWFMIVAAGDHELALADATTSRSCDERHSYRSFERASVIVTHGGLGSVKEAITQGVPLVVVPLAVDQPGNAARVVYHRVGLTVDAKSASVEQIAAALDTATTSPEIASSIMGMRDSFIATERTSSGAGTGGRPRSLSSNLFGHSRVASRAHAWDAAR